MKEHLNPEYKGAVSLRCLFRRTPLALAMTVVLAPALAADEETSADELDTMEVESTALDASPVGPDFGYVGERSLTATKFDMPVYKTPRAISIVTRENMDDRGAISIGDALRYSPSVHANRFGEDNRLDRYIVRGTLQGSDGNYRDGTKVMTTGFYTWKINEALIERVEVLRGASSTMYGQNPPGGVLNMVTKRPQGAESFGEFELRYGSWDRKEAMLDLGDGTDTLSWRLVAAGTQRHTQYDDGDQPSVDDWMIAPSLNFNKGGTDLTLMFNYEKEQSDPTIQFNPIEGTLHGNQNGYIDDDSPLGDTDLEKWGATKWSAGWNLDQAFGENTRLHQSARYEQMYLDYAQMYSAGYAADTALGAVLDPTGQRNTILRGLQREEGIQDVFTIDTHLVHDFTTGPVDHSVMFGVDYQMTEVEGKNNGGDVTLVGDADNPTVVGFNPFTSSFITIPGMAHDVFNPSYGGNYSLVSLQGLQNGLVTGDFSGATQSWDGFYKHTTDAHQVGGYMQYKLSWNDKLNVLWGIRFDDAKTTTKNYRTGQKGVSESDEVTNSISASYAFDNGLVPYFNWSQFFLPNTLVSQSGNIAAPRTGDTYELGLKYKPNFFDGHFAIALFETDEENRVTTLDPVTGDFQQAGLVKSQGVELEAVANITPRLSFLGSATFMNVEIKEDSDPTKTGKRPSQVPNNMAKAWLSYRFGGMLEGLMLAGGLTYTGETFGDDRETIKVPEYTLFDATIAYKRSGFKAQVSAKNLMDHEYVGSCTEAYCYYGDRMNIVSSIGYEW